MRDRLRFPVIAIAVPLVVALAITLSCKDKPHAMGFVNPGAVGELVQVVDTTGQPMGGTGNPIYVQSPTNASPSVVDTSGGDLALNQIVTFPGDSGAGVITDAGNLDGSLISVQFYNTGTVPGYLQFFAGTGTSLDAGGINGSGLQPMYSIPCPAGGTICSWGVPQTFSGGLQWYSSSTQGTLIVDASAPTMAVYVSRR